MTWFTGHRMRPAEMAALVDPRAFRCAACGRIHTWTPDTAWCEERPRVLAGDSRRPAPAQRRHRSPSGKRGASSSGGGPKIPHVAGSLGAVAVQA